MFSLDVGKVASRQRTLLSHFSTESPSAYRIGSVSVISRKDRPLVAAPSPFVVALPLERSATSASPAPFSLGTPRDCSLSCCINFSDKDLPVPS